MTTIFIVKSSNCEPYEDYSEWIDSVWSTYDAALQRIEKGLGFPQVAWGGLKKDRWEKKFPEYPKREDYNSEEEWAECFDKEGKLIPYWVDSEDAWIEAYPIDGRWS